MLWKLRASGSAQVYLSLKRTHKFGLEGKPKTNVSGEALQSGEDNLLKRLIVRAEVLVTYQFHLPQGPLLETVTRSPVMQDCLFIRHSERSWTSSDVQTGLTVSGQSGQIHSAVSFTTLQPRLYGAEQLMVLHGSGGLAETVQQHKTRCLKV